MARVCVIDKTRGNNVMIRYDYVRIDVYVLQHASRERRRKQVLASKFIVQIECIHQQIYQNNNNISSNTFIV